MTALREAAQQALEALERYDGCLTHFHERIDHSLAITTLRAALADGDKLSPGEPVQELALQTCNCRWDGEAQVQQG